MPRLAPPVTPPALWGGVEATLNRVGDRYFDQLELTGHDRRLEDLDRIASLGIRTVRYPLLWERVEPRRGQYDWSWTDARLDRLAALGIEPIAGLVHHGSGPRWTSLVSPDFADALAEYADAVADRYPHLRHYTIVNEPLTTARFAALYGHWYPHARDDRAFVCAVLQQCRGIVLGMRAVRRRQPQAVLVQTEDISRTFARPGAAAQARFYNDRRWLAFDLLCGRVTPDHPLWPYLRSAGASEADLSFFLDRPTPPDIFGANYYVTSDRYLDDRLERYPPALWYQSPLGAFVDVEAVRTPRGLLGHRGMLEDVWQRYRAPIAITEVHLGGSRDEQIRWLLEAWRAAMAARRDGRPVVAVTAWSLFGCMDWDSLVTQPRGHYEPGAFDVRGGVCRPTALGRAMVALAQGVPVRHPVTRGVGWWRASRLSRGLAQRRLPPRRRAILITGATGTLGQALSRSCDGRRLDHHLLSRRHMDIADRAAVRHALDAHRPWAVVNTAGYVRVDDAERDPERCWRENVVGAQVLAEETAARRIPLVTLSSDLVFDGARTRPYVERHPTAPLSVYGRSKAAAEAAVLGAAPASLVVRTAAFFGPVDPWNFVTRALQTLAAGESCRALEDSVVSPTYVPDLADAMLDLLIDGASGIWHLANRGELSFAELTRRAARRLGLDADLVQGCSGEDLGLTAPRPRYSALATERGYCLRPVEDALDAYVNEMSGAFKPGDPLAGAVQPVAS